MAWSEYSRFVGDVFGAPLAMEGLVAFFVESTFLGLWIFGWDRLPRRRAPGLRVGVLAGDDRVGVLHPRGQLVDAAPGRRRAGRRPAAADVDLGGAGQLDACSRRSRTRSRARSRWPARSWSASAAWQLWRARPDGGRVAGVGAARRVGRRGRVRRAGGQRGPAVKLMFEQQPMKMAAAEALCHTEAAGRVLGLRGRRRGRAGLRERQVDHRAGAAVVPGERRLRRRRSPASSDLVDAVPGSEYGAHYPVDPRLGELSGKPIDYVPNLPVTYWGFRLMIGFGALGAFVGVAVLWLTRRGAVPRTPLVPGARAGRHRDAVPGQQLRLDLHRDGPPAVRRRAQPVRCGRCVDVHRAGGVRAVRRRGADVADRADLVYGVLAVVEVFLIRRYVRGGIAAVLPPDRPDRPGRSDRTTRRAVVRLLTGAVMTLPTIWFVDHRRAVARLPVPGGVRLRRRHAAARARPGRGDAARADQHDRPGVGRQRGVADRRGGRHVRGVPGLVRGPVQRGRTCRCCWCCWP